MSAALGFHDDAWAKGFEREPLQTVSEWADAHRILTSIDSAEAGPWRTSRTPYLREIMDCLSPHHPCKRVVLQAGAQLGKTQGGNNWIGYIIHRSPGPMLLVLPTVEMAKRISKQRLAPMIAATPVLRSRIADARERDSRNTVQVKEFEGGLLIVTGANAGSGLRSMPIRFLMLDEVDEYPGDVDGQGDPVALAEQRMATFSRSKEYLTSTPTLRGLSRIESEFLASDQRRYFIPCPDCGHMDFLIWRIGGWSGKEGQHHHIHFENRDPATAVMRCGECDARIGEQWKTQMLERGEWRATAAGDGETVGFHLSSLYSPLGWKSWSSCVTEFLRAKDDPFKLKTWVNTVLGETWEERGDAIDAHTLKSRLETYFPVRTELDEAATPDVPHGVGVLVAAVDVQGDRLEVKVKGYGAGEESWLIALDTIREDPSQAKAWFELDKFLAETYLHEGGRQMRVECTVVDSGGLHTEHVYRYCKARTSRHVFAIKGGTTAGLPLVDRPSMRNQYRTPLFVLCVDTGKDVVLSRLLVAKPGPGYAHLPTWVDDEYLAQLTSERALRKYVKGRGLVREWKKLRDRNEALDLEVYSLGALYILGPRFVAGLGERAAQWSLPPIGPAPAVPDMESTMANPGNALPRRRGRGGWIDSWKR